MVYIEALLFFILGFAFGQWICDILNSITKLVCTLIEAALSDASLKVVQTNMQIQEIQPPAESAVSAIGFNMPEEEVEYDEE